MSQDENPTPDQTIEDLVDRLVARDVDAADKVIAAVYSDIASGQAPRHRRWVRLLYPLEGSSEADDLKRDIAVRVILKLRADNYRRVAQWRATKDEDGSTFWGWIAMVTYRLAVDHLRSRDVPEQLSHAGNFLWATVEPMDPFAQAFTELADRSDAASLLERLSVAEEYLRASPAERRTLEAAAFMLLDPAGSWEDAARHCEAPTPKAVQKRLYRWLRERKGR